MSRFAVVLAGCGVFDGSEVHEAVSTLISIKKYGCDYVCFSLDKPQFHVINHQIQQPVENESRNIIIESARISRGEIKPLDEYRPEDFDALIFPGGFGVAKNFFSFAIHGPDCEIDNDIKNAILKTHAAGKCIGAMCISTALIARAFKDTNIKPKVTGGKENELFEAIQFMGGESIPCDAKNCCIDQENKIFTTPAYISATDIYEVFQGVDSLISAIKNALAK